MNESWVIQPPILSSRPLPKAKIAQLRLRARLFGEFD